jgi:hypothetical protein
LEFGQLPTNLPLWQAKGNIQNPHQMIQAHTSDQLNVPDNSSDLQYTCPNTKRATWHDTRRATQHKLSNLYGTTPGGTGCTKAR